MHEWLHGTGVALITPFKENQEIDFEALRRVIAHVSEGGVDYLVALGTTGESVTTSLEEKKELLSFIVENNVRNLPLVVGLGGYNTQELIEFLPYLNDFPVIALLSVTPYYNKPGQEGLFQHYTALADASNAPVILYNVPGRTGCNLEAETTLRLANHPNIIAVKEASGDLAQCIAIAKDKPAGFSLISGDDLLTPSIIAVGGCGVISVVANAYPKQFSEMVKAALKGQLKASQELLYKLNDAMILSTEEGNPTGIKGIMEHLGICRATVRLPLVEASASLKEQIKKRL